VSGAFAIDPMPSRERQFEHPALFYTGLDDYLADTLSFIHEGLGADEPVAVAVPGSRLEPLRAELGSAADQVRFLDMNEAGRNPGRILPGVLLAFADEHPDAARVRIIGEPIWPGRSATEYPACVQHEALINLAFAGRPATILCPYDAEGLPPEVLADAEATHPMVLDAGAPRASTSYAVDRVLAECNRPLPELTEHPPLRVDESMLSWARGFAHAEAGRAGLGEDRVADVEMVVNELVTNSVEHGGGMGILRIWIEDAHLVVEVRDLGQLHDPLLGRRPLRPLQARGRGLFLVNHLADLVRLHTGPDGTTMRAYFGLPT
jgi:anti-sigma regulatory factor (Ser/Thr protein kinase)